MPVYKTESKTKDGRIWFFLVCYTDLLGNSKRYKSKKYFTKKEATEQESLFLLKQKEINKNLIFRDLKNEYLEILKKENKESTYYGHNSVINSQITPYFGVKDVFRINIQDIQNWHDILDKKGYSLRYKNKCHMILSSILKIAVKYHGLKRNPAEIIGPFKISGEDKEKIVNTENKLRYITIEQFNQLISVIDVEMWKTFFVLLFYTGMRKGEVQALNWNDVDFEKRQIKVSKTLTVKTKEPYKITSTKNLKNRTIDMNKILFNLLYKYYQSRLKFDNFSEKWFVFGDTRFLAQTTIDNYKKKIFELSKLEKNEITIHEFRHSHVSLVINEAIKNNIDMDALFIMLANRMGHTVAVMQKTYMHLFPNIQDKIVNILDNL